jgi:hypothetical protein
MKVIERWPLNTIERDGGCWQSIHFSPAALIAVAKFYSYCIYVWRVMISNSSAALSLGESSQLQSPMRHVRN